MTVLFLDFDGVLHPDEVYLQRGKPVLRCDGYSLFEHADRLAEILEPYPHVRIVLSTSWVSVFRDFDKAKGFLPQALQERVIGATWHSKGAFGGHYTWGAWSQTTRYEQIMTYVLRHRLANWIAIDNDDHGWPDDKRHHLVHTDDWGGLGDVSAQADLIGKLNGKF